MTTLIDITCTNAKRPGQGDSLEINQYRNWTTVLQAIGLRALITYEHNPTLEERNIKDYGFGTKHTGKHRVWTLEFTTDRDDCYLEQGDNLHLLREDLHNVPVVKNLLETINIDRAIFDLKSETNCNTTVQLI